MNVSTLIGLLCVTLSLVISFMMDGGHLNPYINESAALLVFGGTIGAGVFGISMSSLKRLPGALRQAFMTDSVAQPEKIVAHLMDLSRLARREGLLALESRISDEENPFLRKGLQLVVDGTDGEALRSIMQAEIRNQKHRHDQGSEFFSSLGALAPTIGIMGTIIHLIHMMGGLEDPSSMGPQIAAAFCACLYGVASANVFFFPLATKLANLSDQERFISKIIVEGLVSLQAGESTVVMEERLTTYLSPDKRGQIEGGQERETADERRAA